MTTEFAAVAGIGELYGVSRNLTLPMAAATLLIIVLSGSYRRVEQTAILIGALELAFLMVAAMTRPGLATIARQVSDLPLGNSGFWLLAAALIGAVFKPWMIFYQQSAMAEKRLDYRHYSAARGDTALGAVLTQGVSASVLFVAAATLGSRDAGASLASVGQISEALIPHLGIALGRLVLSLGVLGASIVAANRMFAGAGLGSR
jgi:Mn2+/Fe2+ NRAMP family transporter